VENRLKEALKKDRARVQIGRISRFGLLEMSRQRLRPSLGEYSQIICPRCQGEGRIRSIESLALSVLRLIEEEAMKENTARIIAQLPVDVATFLLNEKREMVRSIEMRHTVAIVLVPNTHLHTPQYEVKRLRKDESSETIGSNAPVSYQLAEVPELTETPWMTAEVVTQEEPAVKGISPSAPAPLPQAAAAKPAVTGNGDGGFIKRLWSNLFGGAKPEQEQAVTAAQPRKAPPRSDGATRQQGRGTGQRGGRHGASGTPRRGDNRRPATKEEGATSGGHRKRPAEHKPAAPASTVQAAESTATATPAPQAPAEESMVNKPVDERGEAQQRDSSQRTGRRRGRRGGSGRRRREEAARSGGTPSGGNPEANNAATEATPPQAQDAVAENRNIPEQRSSEMTTSTETVQRPLFNSGEERSASSQQNQHSEIAAPAKQEERSGSTTASDQAAQTTFPWEQNRGTQDRSGTTVERVISSIHREASEPAAKETAASGAHSAAADAARNNGETSGENRYDSESSDKTNKV